MNAVLSVETLVTDHLDLWTTALKRKSTAGRGSSSKVELYGIRKLRELILELAVRGLLVPQDPNDEPASELLKKIAAEKADLVKAGKIKKEKPLPPISDEDEPFKLPCGWSFLRLGDVLAFEYGNNLPEAKRSGTGEFPVYGSNGVVGSHNESFVAGQCIVIGRKGSAGALNLCLKEGCCVTDVAYYCIPPADLSIQFVFKMLHTLGLDSLGKGIKPGLNRNEAYVVIIPLPPLAEQHRIVAKVDELMALCDQLEQQTEASLGAHQMLVETLLNALTSAADHAQFASAWQRIAGHFDTLFTTEESIDQLKQTILQLAVMGKLVPHDPNDEPASELLKKIAAEKAKLVKEGKIKKEKPLSPIEESDQPFKLPRGWQWARIENATLFSEYGISAKTYEIEDGIPVLKMGDIQDGKVLLGGQKKADRDFEGINELMLEDGDLLYNRTNSAELVGKTGIFRGPSNLYSFASYLIRIRCFDSAVQPAFLNANMNSMFFRKTQIEPHLKQQCGQANVNGTIMKNMIIPVAPIKEQTRIIAKLDELMALCEQLKSCLNDAQTTQLHLADALVEQAIG
jgi:type I restriction enzyme S subunit